MAASPLFGIVPAGQPIVTDPTTAPSESSFLYTISAVRPFSHMTIFLLPGISLPDNAAAAIYFATAAAVAAASATGQNPDFKFLGGVGPGKESAIFKINAAPAENEGVQGIAQEGNNVMIGISIEDANSVSERIQQKGGATSATVGGVKQAQGQPSTTVLAQRIIQNAFNFLAGFSGTAGPGGIEVVPLKAFEEWWKKFEGRVRSDPSFLERPQE